jgi:hypothetical protein
MNNFTIISVISLLLFLTNINAQEVAPLQLGNIWVYNTGTTLVKVTVVDTNSVIDSIVYCKFKSISNYGYISNGHSRLREDGFYAMRRDTSYPAPNHELLYYKKDAIIGDSWTIPEPYYPSFNRVYTIEDTFVTNIFGEATTLKFLTIDSGLLLFEEYWTEKFGKISSSDFGGPLLSLQGCVINGMAYGDTSFTIVSVEDEYPIKGFDLSQNFPNPFNPSTSINFTLPEVGFISLEVFNALGEKVKTLINGFKTEGTHTINFEASALASGTYLYVLRAKNFVQTKKMQLIK